MLIQYMAWGIKFGIGMGIRSYGMSVNGAAVVARQQRLRRRRRLFTSKGTPGLRSSHLPHEPGPTPQNVTVVHSAALQALGTHFVVLASTTRVRHGRARWSRGEVQCSRSITSWATFSRNNTSSCPTYNSNIPPKAPLRKDQECATCPTNFHYPN